MSAWAADGFATADLLGDGRQNKRLIKRANRFADKPTPSIFGACDDWAEIQGACRFLIQKKVTRKKVLGPHVTSTEARMRPHPVALCLHDTTELDFNGHEIHSLGPISYEAQRGRYYLHPAYIVTPEREPLGASPMPGSGHAGLTALLLRPLLLALLAALLRPNPFQRLQSTSDLSFEFAAGRVR